MKYCTRSVKSSLWFFFLPFFSSSLIIKHCCILPPPHSYNSVTCTWDEHIFLRVAFLGCVCVCVFPVLQLIRLFYFIAPSLPVISRLCSCALTSFKSKLSWFSAKFFLGQIWSCLKNVSSFIKTKQVLPQLFESLLRLRRLVDDILLVSHIR